MSRELLLRLYKEIQWWYVIDVLQKGPHLPPTSGIDIHIKFSYSGEFMLGKGYTQEVLIKLFVREKSIRAHAHTFLYVHTYIYIYGFDIRSLSFKAKVPLRRSGKIFAIRESLHTRHSLLLLLHEAIFRTNYPIIPCSPQRVYFNSSSSRVRIYDFPHIY